MTDFKAEIKSRDEIIPADEQLLPLAFPSHLHPILQIDRMWCWKVNIIQS